MPDRCRDAPYIAGLDEPISNRAIEIASLKQMPRLERHLFLTYITKWLGLDTLGATAAESFKQARRLAIDRINKAITYREEKLEEPEISPAMHKQYTEQIENLEAEEKDEAPAMNVVCELSFAAIQQAKKGKFPREKSTTDKNQNYISMFTSELAVKPADRFQFLQRREFQGKRSPPKGDGPAKMPKVEGKRICFIGIVINFSNLYNFTQGRPRALRSRPRWRKAARRAAKTCCDAALDEKPAAPSPVSRTCVRWIWV